MADPAPLLSVRNLETFYGRIMAVRGVSLEVPEGEIVTVLGANGAGKTTILKTISGVLDPQKGAIEFDGRPIHGMDPDRIGAARSQPCARRPRSISLPHREREPGDGRIPARRP